MTTSILALLCVVPDAPSSSKWTEKSGIGMIICMMRLANEAGNDPGDYLQRFSWTSLAVSSLPMLDRSPDNITKMGQIPLIDWIFSSGND